jgi:hypothetical protein
MAQHAYAATTSETAEAPAPSQRAAISLVLPSARTVRGVLFGIILMLTALSLAGQFSAYVLGHPRLKGFVPLFYADAESSVPTWYSSMALLLAALLLAVIAAVKFPDRDRYRYHWLGLALLFVGLSADEVAMFHEYPIDPLREALNAGGALYYTWVIPGFAFVSLLGLALVGFLRHLPAATRQEMILAAALFVGGALGVEMLSGIQADRQGEQNLTYALIISIEELLEMLGVAVFIGALLGHLATCVSRCTFRFDS